MPRRAREVAVPLVAAVPPVAVRLVAAQLRLAASEALLSKRLPRFAVFALTLLCETFAIIHQLFLIQSSAVDNV